MLLMCSNDQDLFVEVWKNVSRLKLSNVGPESCTLSSKDNLVYCEMLTDVVALCKSLVG